MRLGYSEGNAIGHTFFRLPESMGVTSNTPVRYANVCIFSHSDSFPSPTFPYDTMGQAIIEDAITLLTISSSHWHGDWKVRDETDTHPNPQRRPRYVRSLSYYLPYGVSMNNAVCKGTAQHDAAHT